MPEEAVATETQLAKDIGEKTSTAIKDVGFDADFDKGFDEALAKDDASKKATGTPAPTSPAQTATTVTTPEVKAEPAKTEPARKDAIPDIPDALLEPKKETPKATTDQDREKFIAEQTKGLSPKAADRFRALEKAKHEAEQRASRLPDLEKQVTALNERLKAQQDTSEVERLKKQVTELDEALTKVNLLENPKFKARYDGEIEHEIKIAKDVCGESGAEVEVLLRLPESKHRNDRLAEIMDGLGRVEEKKLGNAILQVDALNAKKNAELTNWRENGAHLQELSKQEQAKAANDRQRQIEDAFSIVQKRFGDDKNGIELFRKVDGQDEWNTHVDERFKKVNTILNAPNLSAQDLAEMAAWAIAGNEYRTRFLVQRGLVKKLMDEVASLKGGEPDLGEGEPKDSDRVPANAIDAIVEGAVKAGLVR